MRRRLYLSNSQVEDYASCSWKWYLKNMRREPSTVAPIALVWGTVMHALMEAMLWAQLLGESIDPAEAFEANYRDTVANEQAEGRDIEIKSDFADEDEVLRSGRFLAGKLWEWWQKSPFEVALDRNHEPLIERELAMDLGDDVVYRMKLDYVLRHRAERWLLLTDLKTPKNFCPDLYPLISPQLTDYNIGMDVHRELIGLDQPLRGMAFLEAKKKPIRPKSTTDLAGLVKISAIAPPRTEVTKARRIDELRRIAQDIRSRRFAKQGAHAFNTPCGMCDFAQHVCLPEEGQLYVIDINLEDVSEPESAAA